MLAKYKTCDEVLNEIKNYTFKEFELKTKISICNNFLFDKHINFHTIGDVVPYWAVAKR